MPTIIGPAFLALGDGSSAYARLAIDRGRIAAILPAEGSSEYLCPEGCSVAPGLIDLHTNGADDMLFNRDQGYAVPVASRAYAATGATGFVASVMTAPWESMLHAASEIVEAAHVLEESEPQGARCLGIHFEGPFLNTKFRRVHRGDCLLAASSVRAQEMVDACRGALVMVTLAPEVEGASEFVRAMLENGVACSAGHTAARYAEGLLAIGTGYRSLTHAFNGMGPLDHRDPSLLAAFMQDRRTTVQLICDGHHVSPPMVDLLYRMLGDRVVLTTDFMPPAGPGYRVEGGVMRADDGTIAGSALTMDRALRNYMAFTGLPFAQAIVAASHAPARTIGAQSEVGRIAVGMRADLSFWDDRYEVMATMVGGEFVYRRAEALVPN